MALTDESTGNGFYMPVAPAYGGANNGNGFFGGDWAWILLLLLIGGNGWGFGGGWGGMDGLYPWMNNSQNINNGFRDQMLNTAITSIGDKVTSGFGDIATQLCGGFAGVNAGIANAAAQAEISANSRQMANMQQGFGIQTGISDLRYTVATENCADRAAISDGIRDILAATQNQTQTILNQMCADKLEQKNDTIAQLRSELLYARGQASQDVQTAAIQAGQRALANEVEQYVAPRAVPAYYVQNPNCCSQSYGCGCGA